MSIHAQYPETSRQEMINAFAKAEIYRSGSVDADINYFFNYQ